MHAWLCENPTGADALTWQELPTPAPKAGEVLIQIKAASRNFPDLLTFYVESVIRPGNNLLRRILERGMDSGEFRPMNAETAVHTIVAPMIFLMIWENAMTAYSSSLSMSPLEFLEHQIDVLLHGLVAPSKKA